MSFSANIDELVTENRNKLLGAHPSWKRVRLNEVAKILKGYPFESSSFSKNAGTPLIRIRDILPGQTETYYKGNYDALFLIQPGEILVGMDGDFNCALWAGEPALLNQRVCKITLDESRYSKKFLQYVLPGYLNAINKETLSVTVKHLSSRTIADIPLPLPSLDEQHRIVEEIEKQFTRLDAGAAALRRVQANLKRYRAAVLKAVSEGKLVPTEAELHRVKGGKSGSGVPPLSDKKDQSRDGSATLDTYEPADQLLARILTERRKKWNGKGKHKEPAESDFTNHQALPEGWTWAKAEQICEFITKGTTPAASKMQSNEGEIPFFKVYNLTFTGHLNFEYKPTYIAREIHERDLARSQVKKGDILINIVGPPLGQVSIVPEQIHDANINQAIARFRPVLDGCRHYLALCLMTKHVINWAVNRAKTTAGQTNLTLELCRDLPIPLPPLAEQKRIVAEVERRLSVVEELEAMVDANLHRATRLRQAILQKAFSGELN